MTMTSVDHPGHVPVTHDHVEPTRLAIKSIEEPSQEKDISAMWKSSTPPPTVAHEMQHPLLIKGQ